MLTDPDPDPWKILCFRIRQNDADPLDPDLQHWLKPISHHWAPYKLCSGVDVEPNPNLSVLRWWRTAMNSLLRGSWSHSSQPPTTAESSIMQVRANTIIYIVYLRPLSDGLQDLLCYQ